MTDDSLFLRRLFDRAVAAADPFAPTLAAMPPLPKGRAFVFAVGKAAGPMAEACEAAWGRGRYEGVCITPCGAEGRLHRLHTLVASHPIPDEAGHAAARHGLRAAQGLGPDDLLLALISGGGSALAPLPAHGLTLAEKQAATHALLRSGAPISLINAARRRLSQIKGGGLARAAYPAAVATLVVSDVPGDMPDVVASGPTLPDPVTDEAFKVMIAPYLGMLPAGAQALLLRPTTDRNPVPSGPVQVVVKAADALAAARELAISAGFRVVDLGDAVQGEAREVAFEHAEVARAAAAQGGPTVILSGGETTVTVAGKGHGGRNSEYALALALALEGQADCAGLAADTDGWDGSGPHAGVLFDQATLQMARAAGIDPEAALLRNDSLAVFVASGGVIKTGPTRTNVNDFRALIVRPRC